MHFWQCFLCDTCKSCLVFQQLITDDQISLKWTLLNLQSNGSCIKIFQGSLYESKWCNHPLIVIFANLFTNRTINRFILYLLGSMNWFLILPFQVSIFVRMSSLILPYFNVHFAISYALYHFLIVIVDLLVFEMFTILISSFISVILHSVWSVLLDDYEIYRRLVS